MGEQVTPLPGRKEVRWAVPEGFQVADEPAELNDSLVGSNIYMRWEELGWQLGKITDTITNAKTPASSRSSTIASCGRTGRRARPSSRSPTTATATMPPTTRGSSCNKTPDGLELLVARGWPGPDAAPRVAGVQGARAVRGGVPGIECAVITL